MTSLGGSLATRIASRKAARSETMLSKLALAVTLRRRRFL